MNATDLLKEEHRIIRRVLNAMEVQARRMQSGVAMRPGFFLDAADFLRNFADGCHQRKEDEPFLLAMVDAGMSNQTGPLMIMLAEHDLGRVCNRAIERAADALERGDAEAKDGLIRRTLEYVALKRRHCRREDEFLFPMAERLLAPEARERMRGEFERFDRDETGIRAHRKYSELAAALAEEAG
jgi:hemerythrin-like domain-containing protein